MTRHLKVFDQENSHHTEKLKRTIVLTAILQEGKRLFTSMREAPVISSF